MGTDHEPVKPTLSRNARGKLSRSVINKTIPAILRSDARARRGVEAAELIVDPPAPSSSLAKGRKQQNQQDEKTRQDGPGHDEPEHRPPSISISLLPSDTLTAAHALHIQNTASLPPHRRPRLAILNMASPLRPGGGVLSGATSQEESLCRRTTLYPSLREEFYRLPEVGGIYTPDVVAFSTGQAKTVRRRRRDSKGSVGGEEDGEDGEEYPEADEKEGEGEAGSVVVDERKDWFYVDVVTAAMLRFPDVVSVEGAGGEEARPEQVYAEQSDRELVVQKMRAVMRILRAKGVEQVVLGAWGCGAYGNPVGEIARAWRKVLRGGKASSSGKKGKKQVEAFDDVEVVFAINDRRMASAFARAFGPGLRVITDGHEEEDARDSDSLGSHEEEDNTNTTTA